MFTGLELIPISTLLTLITSQVLEIALAAQDVLIEKESFQKLSRYLCDIEPVLNELKERCFKDLAAANQALHSLKADLDRAHTLVKDCQDKSKFYLLMNCRAIVKDAQLVTRDIGKDLELLSLAGTELSLDVRDNLYRLKNQFMSAEYQASEARLQVLDRLEMGIREHRTDQGFANDLIVAIARAVGVPVEPSEISKELSSFKKEKEHLAERKARQEEAFMEQVIKLLSKADAAYTSDVLRQNYTETLNNINGGFGEDEPIEPLSSFKCPLKDEVMVDPVTTSSNRTYEREEIERWFKNGYTTDPVTHLELSDFSLRPNNSLRKTIQEWTERNYCIRIRKAKRLLEGKDESAVETALDDLCKLCEGSSTNKEWIAAANLIGDIVGALTIRNKQIQRKALEVLHILVENNMKNKDEVVQVGGLAQVVLCLGKNLLSKVAVSLLLELLQGDETLVCEKLCQEKSAILYLVMLQNNEDTTAKLILGKLCDKDQNVVQMATMSYFEPLISRICEGGDESKLVMARAIGSIESLSDQNKLMLGEKGVIPPLIQMMLSGSIETKDAALGALKNLSSNVQNQQHIARAGGFPILIDQLISPRSPPNSRESAAITLKNLTTGSGDASLVDKFGAAVDLRDAVETLLGVLEASSYGLSLRAHILQALLGMALSSDGAQVQGVIKARQGIPFLVSLLEGTEREVRDSAIHLLCCISGPGGESVIAKCLLKNEKLGFLVNLLARSAAGDTRAALATILGNLPNDKDITEALFNAGAVPAVLSLIKGDNSRVTEAALSALHRFTDPSNLQLQRLLVDSNIHSLLVAVLTSGTVQAKARAAYALKNLSISTAELSISPTTSGWLCFRPTVPSVCKVHAGVCSVRNTFCIVEAKAIPGLVALLDEPSSVAAEAGVEALLTLVSNTETAEKGAQYLHEVDAIDKVMGLLAHGTDKSKEQTVNFLQCIFSFKKMRDLYGSKAKLPLVELATNGSIKRKAGRVLAQLSMIQEASSYF